MENRVKVAPSGAATSPESAMASELFDQFVSAGTFKSVSLTYRQLCEVLRLKPNNISNFYPRLKAKLHSWRAASLWAKLDKRASHKCYNRGKACPNTRVLIIGAGPCGLRAAIEAQLLGAKVVVIEKRDRFSRNNVLHLWPFVIHDLRNLGAKKFFGKFCAGSIDHISIRQLQLILLKVALLLGVEVHANVGFESLKEPPEDQEQERIGWRACINPPDHPVSQYEFDVLIGADGKRNTLLGFNRKEFRGKLAIAVTVNFINRHTLEEARVQEISGVAFIFNQKFFQDMREQTGIDLENIVYYKDDTHYFVMTAKKQSLLDRGVIINDYNDTAKLLSVENVDREALMEYARDAANFATCYQLPSVDFAVNHYGQADVAMFDFTSMYAAENACRITERKGHKLLQGLVGDSLLEPFWPTGSGCARGFLSSFDVAWMIRSWASGKMTSMQVLAERESIYRLLAQTTPENLSKDINQYTLNPSSRYPNLNLHAVLPSQVRSLYNTDGKVDDQIIDVPIEVPKKKKRRESMIHPDALLNWCQRQVALHDNIKIENMTSSWKNGLALCAILYRYRPDLLDLNALRPEDIAKNNQLAFDICEKELGISPIMTGQEMADCEVPDKLCMISYLSQVYECFRGDIPVVYLPKSSNEDRAVSPNRQSIGTPLSILSKISNKFQNRRKYSIEKEVKEKADNIRRRHPVLIHKRRSREKDKGIALDLVSTDVTLTNYKNTPSNTTKELINSRVKNLEEKLRRDAGLRCHLEETEQSKVVPPSRSEHTEQSIKLLQEQLKKNGSEVKKSGGMKVGKLRKDEWNVKMLEERIKQQQKSLQKTSGVEKSKILQEIHDNKLRLIDAKLKAGGALTPEEQARFKTFDFSLKKLNEKLTKGNLEAGERGHNQVAAMVEHMTTIWDKRALRKKDPLPPAPVAPVVNTVTNAKPVTHIGGSEICYFCNERVYLMERLSAEGLFFHRSCFKCEYCSASLRLGNYSFDRDAASGGKLKFYCRPHYRMQKPDHRWQEMMKRKQAFLSSAFDEQEKEKIYTTLLAKTEQALSPNKQQTVDAKPEITVTDSPRVSTVDQNDRIEDDNKAPNLLDVSNPFGRDQTPERVEYENSFMEISEEELLTGELDEEELTQKNLGPSQDLPTSDDDYSDLSTDTESDEEAFAEELERSLTADETRKLAENWKRKHSLLDSSSPSSSSSSAEEESSDTEVGTDDDTSDDVDSDAEYNIENNEDVPTSIESEQTVELAVKTSDVKGDLMVEVPVIDLKAMKQDDSEGDNMTDSDISEELSEGDECSDESETEIESEPELELPPPQIPTIIIDESPPQDADQEQEWTQEVVSLVMNKQADVSDSFNDNNTSCEFSSNVAESKLPFSSDDCKENSQFNCDSVTELRVSVCDQKITDDEVTMPNTLNFDTSDKSSHLSGVAKNDGHQEVDETAHLISEVTTDDYYAELSKQVMPSDDSLTSPSCVHQASTVTNTFAISRQLTSESNQMQKNEESKIQINSVSSTVTTNALNENEETKIPSTLKEICDNKQDTNCINADSDSASAKNEQLVDEYSTETVSDPKNTDVIQDKDLSLNESQESQDSSHFSFVTFRKKGGNNSKHNDSFNWDSDNSISVPWFCENDESFGIDFSKNDSKVSEENVCKAQIVGGSVVDSVISNNEKELSYKKYEELKNTSNNLNICDSALLENKEKIDVTSNNNNSYQEKCDLSLNLVNSNVPMYSENAHLESNEISHTLVPNANESSMLLTNNDNENNQNCIKYSSPVKSNDEKTDNTNVMSSINVSPIHSHTVDEPVDQSISPEKCSSSEKKYSGYSGSFAEKIRPKSLFGDSIYLRSLDINLQKQQFPLLTKSNDTLDELEDNIKYNVRKKLFHSSDKVLNKQNFELNNNTVPFALDTDESKIKNASLSHPKLTDLPDSSKKGVLVNKIFLSNIDSNVNKPKCLDSGKATVLFQETSSDPMSPYIYAQTRPTFDNVFPVKMRPKCEIDTEKLREKREKRKSVHENIQGLPFADEEKATTPCDAPVFPDVFKCKENFEDNECFDNDFSYVNHEKDCSEQDNDVRICRSVEQEKARKEARARARLKSDEELGLSPNNYRKKYNRQLSLNSIYYEELCSDEFYDHENEEMEDEVIDGTFRAKRVEIIEPCNAVSDTEHDIKKSSPAASIEESSNHFSLVSPSGVHTSDEPSVVHSSSFSKTDVANYLESPSLIENDFGELIEQKNEPRLLHVSTSREKTSSSDTSPDIHVGEVPCFESKILNKSKQKAYHRGESSGEDEKMKSNGKKSFFSILNFGKGNILKEKNGKLSKDNDKEHSTSLPDDLEVKHQSKQKTFANLKLKKPREMCKEKQQKKSVASDISKKLKTNSTNISESPKANVRESKGILLNSNQQKIVPKYLVYRNPETSLSALPPHVQIHNTDNRLAPKASEDSFSDTEDDTCSHKAQGVAGSSASSKSEKVLNEKEKKAQKTIFKVQRQQELKRLRTAQEIQRRLEELEVQQKELEQQGVELEKVCRGERQGAYSSNKENELMQEWYTLVHTKNKLRREEQELLIRLKDLELEDRHIRLHQEMHERMSQSESQKRPSQINEERKILAEMLEIIEKRNELVAMLDQLRIKEETEEKNLESQLLAKKAELGTEV